MSAADVESLAANLDALLEKVAAGETITILRNKVAVAELRPPRHFETGPRPIGLCRGEFVVPDDFNDPLPADVIASFEGS